MHDVVAFMAADNPVPQFPEGVFWRIMLLLFTRPLPRDRSMAEDHGPPEAGQLLRVWTRGRT